MHQYIVYNDSTPWIEFYESIRFSDLLDRGLIEGLSPNQAIFSTFSIEIQYYILHNDSKPLA